MYSVYGVKTSAKPQKMQLDVEVSQPAFVSNPDYIMWYLLAMTKF